MTLQSEGLFRVEITVQPDVIVLDLFGELDSATMSRFETALETLNSARPLHAVFDLSEAEFISVAGYAAIGHCTVDVEQVTVCSRIALAEKILRILGYDRLHFISTGSSNLDLGPFPWVPTGSELDFSTIQWWRDAAH